MKYSISLTDFIIYLLICYFLILYKPVCYFIQYLLITLKLIGYQWGAPFEDEDEMNEKGEPNIVKLTHAKLDSKNLIT